MKKKKNISPDSQVNILDYDGKPFIPICPKCMMGTELGEIHGDIRTKCCNWLYGKTVSEEYAEHRTHERLLQ